MTAPHASNDAPRRSSRFGSLALFLLALASGSKAASVVPRESSHQAPRVADRTQPAWSLDVAGALRTAAATDRHVLYLFSGSDWSSLSQGWMETSLGRSDFLERAARRYVLVQVDFPKGTEARARVVDTRANSDLMRRYHVRDLPLLVAVDEQARPLAELGYLAGGIDPILEVLEERVRHGEALIERALAFGDSLESCAEDTACRSGVLREVARFLEDSAEASPAADLLYELLGRAFEESGPGAEELQVRAVRCFLSGGRGDLEILGLAHRLDPVNAAGLFGLAMEAAFDSLGDGRDIERYRLEFVEFIEHVETTGCSERLAAIALDLANLCFTASLAGDRSSAERLARWAAEVTTDPRVRSRARDLTERLRGDPLD